MNAHANEITAQIRRWSLRARWQRGLAWLAFGLAIGLGCALLLSLIARVTPVASSRDVAVFAVGLAMLGLLGTVAAPWLLTLRRSLTQWAREFDQRFALGERLSTALELDSGGIVMRNPALREHQLADAAATAAAVDARSALPLRVSLRGLAICALLTLGLAVSLALPNSQDAVVAGQASLRAALQQQINQLEQARQNLEQSALPSDQKERALQALLQAQNALRDPNISPERAMAAVNDAQNKIDALQDQNAREAEADLREAGRAMGADELTNELSDSLRQGQFDKAAQQIQQLARNDGNPLNSDESERIARQLDQAARRTQGSDETLSRQLRDAAQNLRTGNMDDARDNLAKAAQSLQKTAQNSRDNNQLSSARQSAENARQAISQAANDQRNSAQQPQAAQSGQSGSSAQQRPQAGQTGQSDQPGAEAAGQSQAQGGEKAGSVGADGPGDYSQPSAGAAGHNEDSGSSDSVYAPGRLTTTGKQVILQQDKGKNAPNPNGQRSTAPDGESSVPYQQVLPDYSQAADDALQNGSVPADRRDYVRDYFSTLDPRSPAR